MYHMIPTNSPNYWKSCIKSISISQKKILPSKKKLQNHYIWSMMTASIQQCQSVGVVFQSSRLTICCFLLSDHGLELGVEDQFSFVRVYQLSFQFLQALVILILDSDLVDIKGISLAEPLHLHHVQLVRSLHQPNAFHSVNGMNFYSVRKCYIYAQPMLCCFDCTSHTQVKSLTATFILAQMRCALSQ